MWRCRPHLAWRAAARSSRNQPHHRWSGLELGVEIIDGAPDVDERRETRPFSEHFSRHVVVMQERLTRAFQQKNVDSILYYSADLGHYIQDAHVPLHTTLNYDGQLTGQHGLHSLWESKLPEQNLKGYSLKHKEAKYLAYPEHEIWEVIRASHRDLPNMLALEKEVHDERLWMGITRATGALGNTSCLVGTAEQVAEAILAYYRLGIASFLMRGFDPVGDTAEFGHELIPRIRAGAAAIDRLAAA